LSDALVANQVRDYVAAIQYEKSVLIGDNG
jgi:glycerol-3-phosphate dehydrogenase